MDRELKRQAQEPETTRLLAPTTITALERAKYFAGAGLMVGGLAELFGMGTMGLLFGLAAGGTAAYFSEEIRGKIMDRLPAPRRHTSTRLGKLHWWLGHHGPRPADDDSLSVPEQEEEPIGFEADFEEEEPEPEDETIFSQHQQHTAVCPIARITTDDMVRHTERNSYTVWIGRSLTRANNPAVRIDFYKRHIKIIGASQHGKSSMAAALLESIIRTHDRRRVLLALLDLEDKTSRLFANCAHIMRVQVSETGETVKLHARSYQEVLHRLEVLSAIIDARYKLTAEQGEAVLDNEPIILIYLEEFVDLKNYFKQRAAAASKQEKEQATQDYERLIYCISKIAARGLKVLVQLLMCAQVDYRDDDLQEALVNVTSGMSFCVRPTAAAAAGFYRSDLIKRNAMEDQIGQCVVEMPECKDLILAPEYDLRARLRALPNTPPIYRPGNGEMPISAPVNESVNGSTSHSEPSSTRPHLHLLGNEENEEAEHETTQVPAGNENGNVTAEIKEVIRRMYEDGIKHNKIAKLVKLDGRNYGLYKQICHELGIGEKEA